MYQGEEDLMKKRNLRMAAILMAAAVSVGTLLPASAVMADEGAPEASPDGAITEASPDGAAAEASPDGAAAEASTDAAAAEASPDEGDYITTEEDSSTDDVEPEVSDADADSLTGASSTASSYFPSAGVSALYSRYPAIRNQGTVSSGNTCWAFTTIAQAEFYDINKGLKASGTSTDYSEMALAYSTYHPFSDPLGGLNGDSVAVTDTGKDWISIGGSLSWAQQSLARWTGVRQESQVPYTDQEKSALDRNGLTSSQQTDDTVRLRNAYRVSIAGENGRKNAKKLIESLGGLGVPLYFSNTSNYVLGASYYCDTKISPNHAVMIVGWDDNYSASNFFKNPGQNGAWLVRNSHGYAGTDQRENITGYFWISYFDKSLGTTGYAAEYEDAADYDNNYQYDGSCSSTFIGGSSSSVTGANVFTARSDEKLKAVSVYTESTNTTATVQIRRNVTGDPSTGTLIDATTKKVKLAYTTDNTSYPYQGYYRIDLTGGSFDGVDLKKGEKFAVIVTLDSTSSSGARLSQERTGSDSDNKVQWTAHIDAGESYQKVGSNWNDLRNSSSGGNLRIKAFTDNDSSTDTRAMHRIFNPSSGEHLYTADENEVLTLVGRYHWKSEGVGWYAPVRSNTPVYRVFNPATGEHLYTIDHNEYTTLVSQYHWNDEGIAWYSDDSKNLPVYREFKAGNSPAGCHNYTADSHEHRTLISQYGWNNEGIAWYGMSS